MSTIDACPVGRDEAEVLMAIRNDNWREEQEPILQLAGLEGLPQHLADIQETAFRHLARELHDQVGCNLTALGLILTSLQAELNSETLSAHDSLVLVEQATALVQETTRVTRDIMSELRPPLLDQFGLSDALEWYAGKVAEHVAVSFCLQVNHSLPRRSPAVEIALFRIAQEAITNALKHARATSVTVSLDQFEGVTTLTVADNGVGFDMTSECIGDRAPRWGLLTMRERALGVGAWLRVESQPGVGTMIIVEVAE